MKFHKIITGDALESLKTLESGSVQCVVTSPPYYGLRDYGTAEWVGGDAACDHRFRDAKRDQTSTLVVPTNAEGFALNHYKSICKKCGAKRVDSQIGMEDTPEFYISRLVEVFREARRVLKDDGICWINLGSSYASSKTNPTPSLDVERVPSCGNCDKELQGCQALDYVCCGLCDEHLTDFLDHCRRIFYNNQTQEQVSLHGAKKDHDSERMDLSSTLLGGVPLSVQVSTIVESFLQLRGECFRCSSRASYPSKHHSCADASPAFFHNSGASEDTSCCNQGNVLRASQQNIYSQYISKVCACCKFSSKFSCDIYPHYTMNFKQKDLMNIPFYVAEALRADGWYLRSEIVWAKPNTFPESVKDRPTKSHEMIYLLSKQPKYYYDADSIKEPCVTYDKRGADKLSKRMTEQNIKTRPEHKNMMFDGQLPNSFHKNRAEGGADKQYEFRNKRDVWFVNTSPFRNKLPEGVQHFAVFPEKLIEPCILAGSKEGDVVLDPFSGSGTTGVVAKRFGRSYIGLELNPDYVKLSEKRIGETNG